MERNELISKLCKEAAENTPDIYDKILSAAEAEGLLSGGAGAGLSAGAGSGTVRGVGGNVVKSAAGAAAKSRVAAAVAVLIAAFTATAAVGVPLALNANSGLGGGSQIEAPDGSGTDDNGGNGSGDNSGNGSQTPSDPSTPSTPVTPENPDPENPVDPDGVKSIFILHKYGSGKYLWDAQDVSDGKYNLYGAQLEITRNDGTVYSQPLTYDMFSNSVSSSIGNHEVTVSYGEKTTEFSVFVTSDYLKIEAVADNCQLNGSLDTVIYNPAYPYELDLNGLEIEGEFNVEYNGTTYFNYYGTTPVNYRFIQNFDSSKTGLQTCQIAAGNISLYPEIISEFNALGYESYDITEKVFLSGVIILNADGQIVYYTDVSPEKPYINIKNIPDRFYYYEPDYKAEFVFKIGDFAEYSGGGVTVTVADNIRNFDYAGYEISGNTDLWSVLNIGERTIKLENWYETIEVPFTVYDSDYTNIRFCRVQGEDVLSYELTNGVTLDTIKNDLLTKTLYVEYFEKVNGIYIELVPVAEYMLNFDNVDENSYGLQYGSINYYDKSIAVNITKPYTIEGANVLCNLTNSNGINLILSDATVNDLGQCMKDACKEIVLYDNGVAMLKHTGNSIGNVLTGYKLEGNNLTLLRHGIATSFLTVDLSAKTFKQIDLNSVTSGLDYTTYSFSHKYFPDADMPIAWYGTFTAYIGQTGFDYAGYVNVYLTGWASTPNDEGYSYQIAGIEYVATWAYGWHNNKQAFVLRFADRDWWFEIGTTDSSGRYKLTFIQTVNAS